MSYSAALALLRAAASFLQNLQVAFSPVELAASVANSVPNFNACTQIPQRIKSHSLACFRNQGTRNGGVAPPQGEYGTVDEFQKGGSKAELSVSMMTLQQQLTGTIIGRAGA